MADDSYAEHAEKYHFHDDCCCDYDSDVSIKSNQNRIYDRDCVYFISIDNVELCYRCK